MKMLQKLLYVASIFAGLVSSQAGKPVPSPDPSAPMVDLGYVKYQGTTSEHKGINYFRGIQ